MLYVLPVAQPFAQQLADGKTRQVSRNFPPADPAVVGSWFAIQATTWNEERRRLGLLPGHQWAIIAVGKLTGAGYYPGFFMDPTTHHGRAYKRELGQAGAWVWHFTNVVRVEPIPLERLGEERWGEVPKHHVDDGSGDWWGCFPRELEQAMVDRVREARRKAMTA